MDIEHLENYPWWSYLEEGQRDGLSASFDLLGREVKAPSSNIHDYSFIVFPAAKAYEGFLKKLFFDLGFIRGIDYNGDRFRIGKALNPSLEKELREESIYDKLAEFCQGQDLPDKLWATWRECRNLIFHYWPAHRNVISISEAQQKLEKIIDAINSAFVECKIKR